RAWDQTRERARRSKHHWGYDLHLPLPCSILNTRTASVWSHPSSSLLLRWPRQLEVLVRGRRERSERGGRSHIISNLRLGNRPFTRSAAVTTQQPNKGECMMNRREVLRSLPALAMAEGFLSQGPKPTI